MGLDVVGYKNVKVVDDAETADVNGDELYDVCYDRGWFIPSVDYFSDHVGDLKDVPYSHDGEYDFRAGSYGGYNQWRNELAKLAGYGSAENVWRNNPPWTDPFVPLINFSDCEGTIGPKFCAQLLQDFEKYHDAAKEWGDEYFLGVYEDFLEALRFVGPNGILCFC